MIKQTSKKNTGSFASVHTDDTTRVIKIHEGAIASIAKRAALSTDGVTRLSGSSFVDNLAELVGSKKIQDRAISVKISGAKVALELSINVKYGVHLPTIANDVQKHIALAIREMTGLEAAKINVNIREMEDAPEENSDDDL